MLLRLLRQNTSMQTSKPEAAAPNPFREALARKGSTIERGAAETGYSPSYFAMMMREPRLMSVRMLARIAEVLGVPLSEAER